MKIDTVIVVFDALSKEKRLLIYRILVEHSQNGITPTDISKLMGGIPRNTLSFHLSILTKANLCQFEKVGKMVIYKPNCEVIKQIAGFLFKDCCEGECKC